MKSTISNNSLIIRSSTSACGVKELITWMNTIIWLQVLLLLDHPLKTQFVTWPQTHKLASCNLILFTSTFHHHWPLSEVKQELACVMQQRHPQDTLLSLTRSANWQLLQIIHYLTTGLWRSCTMVIHVRNLRLQSLSLCNGIRYIMLHWHPRT